MDKIVIKISDEEAIVRMMHKAKYYTHMGNYEEASVYSLAIYALENQVQIKSWLSSFSTDSATECFTAVQELKEKLNGQMD